MFSVNCVWVCAPGIMQRKTVEKMFCFIFSILMALSFVGAVVSENYRIHLVVHHYVQ